MSYDRRSDVWVQLMAASMIVAVDKYDNYIAIAYQASLLADEAMKEFEMRHEVKNGVWVQHERKSKP